MFDKRGLSPVVANVLIILLVIAAVAIVWAVVRPAIEGAGEEIETSADCLTVDFEVLSCDGLANNVVVRRNAGGDNTALDYIITVVGGASVSGTSTNPLTPLTSETVNNVAFATGAEVNAAAILASGDICDPQNSAVTC